MEDDLYFYALAMSDGRIRGVTTGPYLYVRCDETVNDVTHYVDVATGEIQLKRGLEFELTTGGLTVTLTGLPAGMSVETNGTNTETDDAPLVITYDVPGTYAITLSGHVEYLDDTLEVVVGDA
ncbi:hypothetical protein J7J47_11845 [Halomonas sp. ISL-60]|uniref:hypothetical protein n=1 Tax=Halomonas sp. ISL-56 TaxID=2819149 RepID=UPI001BEC94E1|nr:hypothetical protein [Halomonas sp. ISL-56]MBT2772915.1 hypothetical protein [Halomonas sp. ISL-60]MBT2799962.1 hypothetical protein [Halomonas sp. ISL-56]